MLIRKIEMLNFRQFKGKNEIEFSTDENKNVTVIMGDNGAGKTTLAQAFMWCLYGSNDFKIKELINREVRDGMMPSDSIEVKVSLWIHANEKENMVVRRKVYYRTNSKVEVREESFSVASKNEKTSEWDFMNQNASDVFIKNMLPKELSRFFFFDGERMDAMSKELESGRSKEFADAVQGLVGLTSLKNAILHFKPSLSSSVIGKIDAEIQKNGNHKMTDYMTRINECNELIERSAARIAELEPEITYYTELALKCKNDILAMSSQIDMKRDYEKMNKQLQELQREKNIAVDSLVKYFSACSMKYFSMPLIQDALLELKQADKLDKGIPKLHADTISFLLKRGKCICGESLEAGQPACQELYKLLDVVPPKSLGQSISEYVSQERNNASNAQQYSTTLKMYVKGVRDKSNQISKLERDISDIYALLTDTSKAKMLEEQKESAERERKKREEEKNKLIGQIATAEKDKKYQEAERDKLLLLDEQNKKNRILREYAQFIYENMVEEYSKKENAVRADLEKEINGVFRDIYDEGIAIEVDERYNIKVKVKDITSSNDALEKNTAQNYAIIFAFISGIISLAKKNQAELNLLYDRENEETFDGYPLVMDAPLSAFDKTRIKNICETIPNIAQQVIMFIKDTDGEVAEENMKSKIGSQYMMNAVTKTHTIVEER